MNKKFLLLIILLALVNCKNTSKTLLPQAISQEDSQFSFYWQVESPEGKKSLMLGTQHIGVSSKDLPQHIFQSLNTCQRLYLEIIPDLAAQVKMAKMLVNEKGNPLSKQLGKEYFEKLLLRAPEYPAEALEQMHPAMVNVILSIKESFTPEEQMQGGIDNYVQGLAEENNKVVLALETPEEQILALKNSFSITSLKEFLDSDPKENALETKKLTSTYTKGTLKSMEDLVITESLKDGESGALFLEHLLYKRNNNWMIKLIPIMQEGGSFVAVGAAHYLGDQGLVVQLQKAGFKVNQVNKMGFVGSCL